MNFDMKNNQFHGAQLAKRLCLHAMINSMTWEKLRRETMMVWLSFGARNIQKSWNRLGIRAWLSNVDQIPSHLLSEQLSHVECWCSEPCSSRLGPPHLEKCVKCSINWMVVHHLHRFRLSCHELMRKKNLHFGMWSQKVDATFHDVIRSVISTPVCVTVMTICQISDVKFKQNQLPNKATFSQVESGCQLLRLVHPNDAREEQVKAVHEDFQQCWSHGTLQTFCRQFLNFQPKKI